jgi:ADP-dependent NAD(P)H-hydrate dehydratase / NAD(P)H-hydrate epimerase
MKPLLTPEEARALDAATQAAGTPAAALMERAGGAVARSSLDLTGGAYGRRVVVACGKGSNGGDGFVAARHLARVGVRVAVFADDATGTAADMRGRLERETGVRARPLEPSGLRRQLERADAAVDAIAGTGLRGAPDASWAAAIDALNDSGLPVVAVDIPSGVDGATGAVPGAAVRAELTVAFGAAKIGTALLPGAELAGTIRVVDIGFDEDAMASTAWLAEPSDVAAVLPARSLGGQKKMSGTLVVVAGSRAMTGAARLVARAAMRVGAGYVVVALPASILPVVQADLTEAVYLPLPETDAGSIAPEAVDAVVSAAGDAHAVAIGPGLTRHPSTVSFVREVVRTSPAPLVVDADALNAFEADATSLADRKADAVLTPHGGELARLLGHEPSVDRLAEARGLAEQTRAVALVKGTRTVVVEPGGTARVNPTGSTALATAGTGDVLTGAIGGLLARGIEPFAAAWAGAYLHGLAGLAAADRTGDGTVAGDVADHLPDAIARVEAGG